MTMNNVGRPTGTGASNHTAGQDCKRASDRGRPTVHVQGPADLDPDWFRPEWTVGLTAGTSTLDTTIDAVHDALLSIAASFEVEAMA